jgi:hypothetical protein
VTFELQTFCVECQEWYYDHLFHRHHHHHRKAPPSAPRLSAVAVEENFMAIAGSNTPVITLTLTLPTTRNDGTALALTEIQSATILRDTGSGPASLQVLPGPFSGATAVATDASPASGADTYSFFVTDTAGTQGDTSLPVSITVSGAPVLAPPSAGTLTAVAGDSTTAPTPSKAA